jgi:hypothetical protein
MTDLGRTRRKTWCQYFTFMVFFKVIRFTRAERCFKKLWILVHFDERFDSMSCFYAKAKVLSDCSAQVGLDNWRTFVSRTTVKEVKHSFYHRLNGKNSWPMKDRHRPRMDFNLKILTKFLTRFLVGLNTLHVTNILGRKLLVRILQDVDYMISVGIKQKNIAKEKSYKKSLPRS